MRICIAKATGKLLEMQSDATEGTLIKNALSAGYLATDIEERKITDVEWSDPTAPWNKPSPEQLEAQAEAQRQALFVTYDHEVDILNNRLRRGSITQSDYAAKIAEWDAFAVALEKVNDIDGWYINTVWPDKPE